MRYRHARVRSDDRPRVVIMESEGKEVVRLASQIGQHHVAFGEHVNVLIDSCE